MSHNDGDTRECGRTWVSACQTLPHILHVIAERLDKNTQSLDLVTDKSLAFTDDVLVSPLIFNYISYKTYKILYIQQMIMYSFTRKYTVLDNKSLYRKKQQADILC